MNWTDRFWSKVDRQRTVELLPGIDMRRRGVVASLLAGKPLETIITDYQRPYSVGYYQASVKVSAILRRALAKKGKAMKCEKCDGCGKIADSDEQEPWTAWTGLPLHSAVAVLAGIVKPITCPACSGSGEAPHV